MERANRLSKIETEVDNIYRREISRIFNGEMDLLDIIRWKDVWARWKTRRRSGRARQYHKRGDDEVCLIPR